MASRTLLLGVLAVLWTGCATSVSRAGAWSSSRGWSRAEGTGGSGAVPGGSCTGDTGAVPPGWPDLSASGETLLGPFLACDSPAGFLALQRDVDMPRLVEALDDWSAVRLGARGPMRREEAARVLQRKRAAFLVTVSERYGLEHAEVFALFVLHSAHDDEVDEVLRLLAREKQLGQTLGRMPVVREELERRGLALSRYEERAERPGDVLRGLGRAARDVLATSAVADGTRYQEMTARWGQLPPPYQEAAHEVEQALALRHFAPGHVAVGAFDALTFGVPLGVYALGEGTARGVSSLGEGEYEQAARELAPALLLGAVYAGGRGAGAVATRQGGGLPWAVLREHARQVEARLGGEGVRALAEHLRASREAGVWVAEGGLDAAWVLNEARGDVPRARAMMSRARPGATGASGLAVLVDEGAGQTREWVEARLAVAELEAEGPRLSRDVGVLEQQRPVLERPPPGAASGPRWPEYVAYYERRVGELREGTSSKGPLKWEEYGRMWGGFIRGLEFERRMVKVLRAEAELPRAERRYLKDFEKPRIEVAVGVVKPGTGLRFADVLVIEEGDSGGRPRRIETFSFKSRDLSRLDTDALTAQMKVDANEALRKYGETVRVVRDSLRLLVQGETEVPVRRVRLIYEGGELKPKQRDELRASMRETQSEIPGVEVSFQ